jgi:hypothetical protein
MPIEIIAKPEIMMNCRTNWKVKTLQQNGTPRNSSPHLFLNFIFLHIKIIFIIIKILQKWKCLFSGKFCKFFYTYLQIT